ncbi:MAG: hypothetical protein H0W20_02080 [Chthoniobacterales bacterium]|nr:hypothetical protein [Chthoniobacterales bacterium]
MKTLSVKLPLPLARWLSKQAQEMKRTQSDLVRQALEAQRRGEPGSKSKSCAELLSELDGFFEGSRDLSTNPKYLKDYGK